MRNSYKIKIGEIERNLPIVRLTPELSIASFVILGDVELVTESAKLLKEKAPKVDYIITAEAKGIPLAHELSKELGINRYVVARKSIKAYMNEPISFSVISITTKDPQTLFLNRNDAELISGKKVALVDDVISTGESLNALEELVKKAGGIIEAKMCILAEGDAKNRDDIIYLEELPLFD